MSAEAGASFLMAAFEKPVRQIARFFTHWSSEMPVFQALSKKKSYIKALTPKPSRVEPRPTKLPPPFLNVSSTLALKSWKSPSRLVTPPKLIKVQKIYG